MTPHNNNLDKLLSLLATAAFQKAINGELVNQELLLTAQAALLKAQIPYDVNYSPGTQRIAPFATLLIFITPIWSVRIVFNFNS
ncbi:hypothetical protein EDC18_102173 [Natranaerovirga pectinivora]|uniref:Uncharacterized protein n=1 Tax=Natranaerovirga pectinivora TaxID=682400 RepID=A0A4V2V0H9_9FIRM|nr:hypothetical protein [Natranaerovirga pectinivora]TCT16157.1 hypothetical protein EDC18_102173 [Natranaerovirga pectinivora]